MGAEAHGTCNFKTFNAKKEKSCEKMLPFFSDQSVQPLPRDNHILNFLDAEANINDGELYEPKDEYINHELAAADRKAKKEIRHLEAEIQKWQVLVDKVRGDNPPDFDNQTLAVLRGRLVRYLMRSKEVRTVLPTSVLTKASV